MPQRNYARDILLGVSIGDTLGVPAEFKSRRSLKLHPVDDMIGFGTHNQPPGTWSDDSSLTFCLAECLLSGYDLSDMAARFVNWRDQAYWTAHENVFDIGNTTNIAIEKLKTILNAGKQFELKHLKNNGDVKANGNGSLMRILPLILYIIDKENIAQFEFIWEVSALTHNHIRAAVACFIYLKVAENLIKGQSKQEAYTIMQNDLKLFFQKGLIPAAEQQIFNRIVLQDIVNESEETIPSTGYVVHSLEASLWCFLKYSNYKDIVLAAVNMGDDTDTTAAIAGGLAGLCYGWQTIPESWIKTLAKSNEIMNLADKLNEKYFV